MPHTTIGFGRNGRIGALALLLLTCLSLPSWSQTHASSPDDRALFLAAMPLADASPLKGLERLPAYHEHRKFLATKWEAAQKERWDAMTAWAEKEVWPHVDARLPLIYVFGGPDFANAHVLYPNAPRYILCGLEPVGNVPAFEGMRDDRVSAAVRNVGVAMTSMMEQGFFFTKDMGEDLGRTEAFGVLPLLYAMIARSGHHITEMQFVTLSDTGQIRPIAGEPAGQGPRGVRIVFAARPGAPPQEMVYFRTDLSDAGQKGDDRFLRYLASQGSSSCYLKAAAYLLHQHTFSRIRDLLLSQSRTILQDDSGFPYRALDPTRWKIGLYGNYAGPPSSISWAVQPDLRKAYAVPGAVKPLSFKTSYRAKQYANLLFAIAIAPTAPRKAPDAEGLPRGR